MDGRWYAATGIGFAAAALAVTLTGAADGAIQAPTAAGSTVSKKQVTAIAKKQANKAITARAPGLTVGQAKKAPPTGAAGGNLTGTYPNPLVAPGAITTPRIANGAVTAGKLASGSITEDKFAGAVVAPRNLAEGAVVAQALGGVSIESSSGGSVLPGGTETATVTCPTPTRMLSGGGSASDPALKLVSSYPFTANTWRVVYTNTGGSTHFFTAVATCLEAMGG